MKKNTSKCHRKLLVDVIKDECECCEKDPNIACVGFGLKFVKGKPKLEVALHYYVYQKLSSEDEICKAGSKPIEKEVGGYQTDVLQWTIERPATCPDSNSPTGERGGRKEDPLVGGTSSTVLGDFHSFPTGYGTLGGICFDSSTGDAMAMSNNHVYGTDIGNDAIQPWLPTDEYIEASVKYLFCGGPLAHLFFWTAPSPLTAILTTAAAAAWIAAAASDAEDPSRWGQRTGTVPPAGIKTEREKIHLEADIPRLPFPGRHWKTKTSWDYSRITASDTLSTSIVEERINEHVLVGKRVFTTRPTYRGGDRVKICAQLFTRIDKTPVERFVVAHCFPINDPERIVKRVLKPGDRRCNSIGNSLTKLYPPICLEGIKPQVEQVAQMNFPIRESSFVFYSSAGSTVLHPGSSASNPSGVNALRIPYKDKVVIVCPPSTHVELQVYHFNKTIRAVAVSANGAHIATAETSDEQSVVQKLVLEGPEIVHIELEGGGGEGFLAAICVDKRDIDIEGRKARERYYHGFLDLTLSEPPGLWGVVVMSQTLDTTPTDGDPIQAARRLGGIVDSANIVETGECACTILYDHVFEVI